jgi:hypothetical protein
MVTDAPIIGNGELGAAIGGASLAGGDGTDTASSVSLQQSFYLGQMDFWTEQAISAPPGWTHVAPGHVTLTYTPQMPTAPAPPPSPAPAHQAAAAFDPARHGSSVGLSADGELASWTGAGSTCSATSGTCQAALLKQPVIDFEKLPASFSVVRGPAAYGGDADVGLCAMDADTASGHWIGWQEGKSWLYRAGGRFKDADGGNATACPFEQCGVTYGAGFGVSANLTTIVHSRTMLEFLLNGVSQGKVISKYLLPDGVVGCVAACSGATMNLNAKPGHDPGSAATVSYGATQELYTARANTTVTLVDKTWSSNFTATTSSLVPKDSEDMTDTNALLTRITLSHGATVNVELMTPNRYGLPTLAGAHADTAVFLQRQSNKWVHNAAVLTECSGLSLSLSLTKVFSYDHSTGIIGPLQNATAKAVHDTPQCMWLADDSDERQQFQPRNASIISMGNCGKNGTRWRYDDTTQTIASMDSPGVCICYNCGAQPAQAYEPSVVVPCPCKVALYSDSTTRTKLINCGSNASSASFNGKWSLNNASFQGVGGVTLSAAFGEPSPLPFLVGPQCLGVVRQNLNISLGMAAVLSDAATGKPLPFNISSLAVVNGDPWTAGCVYGPGPCPTKYSASASYSLTAGVEYVLRVAVRTTRGGAATTSALDAAVNEALTLSHTAAEASHARSWTHWWNASGVDLGPRRGTKPQSLEAFYYGAQYMLNSFSRSRGGVIPGLLGPWSTQDPVGWADGITMDYNAEANFYGAASSNHAPSMHSYFPTVSAAIPMGRERAALPDWSFGGHEALVQNLPPPSNDGLSSSVHAGSAKGYTAVGTTGDQTDAMGCACAGMLGYPWCRTDIHNRSCPAGFGGFEGIEFPLQLGGFASMHCSPDGGLRSVAAMAATPFVEYFEYTQDLTFLREQAYPFIREVALFYASYLTIDPATGKYEVPLACAQEFCGERQLPAVPIPGPPGSHGCPQPPQKTPTIDLAYSHYIFEKAAEWSVLLDVRTKALCRRL